ncbi:uncharacterized protein MONOS_407 [Monocercomonoides exilis]|uniref:uncharacterized protein n=1 Tax=Monocercomonoides exilis TaxID=2049356 RepID=UPI0035594E9B|nr:hypothetical protein MONOS_407 [Monocercomonoides exilis]|eukprot:MONOS_407.1-p1 / transcript=MONOS_407.1 / gene=MONOS_407 / organism=Monocercomonoides_exilis_PA203 / gene_product=unspecified product / transcript_product=unspecified product / location=Mono_scaffold00006:280208-281678(+) / protein_length=413 / sequence_SO=supercontig / SO=protein_coding / is_pseudo=false
MKLHDYDDLDYHYLKSKQRSRDSNTLSPQARRLSSSIDDLRQRLSDIYEDYDDDSYGLSASLGRTEPSFIQPIQYIIQPSPYGIGQHQLHPTQLLQPQVALGQPNVVYALDPMTQQLVPISQPLGLQLDSPLLQQGQPQYYVLQQPLAQAYPGLGTPFNVLSSEELPLYTKEDFDSLFNESTSGSPPKEESQNLLDQLGISSNCQASTSCKDASKMAQEHARPADCVQKEQVLIPVKMENGTFVIDPSYASSSSLANYPILCVLPSSCSPCSCNCECSPPLQPVSTAATSAASCQTVQQPILISSLQPCLASEHSSSQKSNCNVHTNDQTNPCAQPLGQAQPQSRQCCQSDSQQQKEPSLADIYGCYQEKEHRKPFCPQRDPTAHTGPRLRTFDDEETKLIATEKYGSPHLF